MITPGDSFVPTHRHGNEKISMFVGFIYTSGYLNFFIKKIKNSETQQLSYNPLNIYLPWKPMSVDYPIIMQSPVNTEGISSPKGQISITIAGALFPEQ
jgi:hypothetical protein